MSLFARDLAAAPIDPGPFPHAVVDDLFAPDVFAELEQGYPICPPASGPTGHTIHRGDAGFDAVMATQPAWRALFEACNSQAFVDRLAILFAAEIDRACLVRRGALRFADHIETRVEKEQGRIAAPRLPQEAMFVRFDFMQGMDAYSRGAHLDHRRRLATMLVYFDAPGPETFRGGDLVLHNSRGNPIAHVPPAANRGVIFPCSERSWHSVDTVTKCRRPRRFVQIAISSAHDIWPTASLPAKSLFESGRRLLRAWRNQ